MASDVRLGRAVQAGVRIAAGSDEYSAAGMPPLEIIRAATLNGAELLGSKTKSGRRAGPPT